MKRTQEMVSLESAPCNKQRKIDLSNRALEIAASKGYFRIIRMMLDQPAPVLFYLQAGNIRDTLFNVVSDWHEEVVRELLNGD